MSDRFEHLTPHKRGVHIPFSPAHLRYSQRWLLAGAMGLAGLAGLAAVSNNPRRVLQQVTIGAASTGAGLIGLGLYGITDLQVEQLTLELVQYPVALPDLIIAHISDFHLGALGSAAILEQALEAVRLAKPHLIMMTGDFIDTEADIPQLQRHLETIEAPLGVYGCLGNHDYWNDPAQVARMVESYGITMLINEHRVIEHGGYAFVIAGVTDPWFGEAKLATALDGAPNEAPRILLAHCPDYFDEAIEAEIMLQLSGHTHAGHIAAPLLGPLVLPHLGVKYYRGLYKHNHSVLYVNRGLSGLPLRIGARPEVTILRLRGLRKE